MIHESDRLKSLEDLAMSLKIPFVGETASAYLARAVSSVPEENKEQLNKVYESIIKGVENAGIKPNLPVELQNIDPNDINRQNHISIVSSKFVIPLTYATSDGRGWEMGFAYTRKLVIPIIMPDQKINTPTLRLPYQIPIVWNGAESLTGLLEEIKDMKIGFGSLNGNETVIGEKNGELFDLRKLAQKHAEVLDHMF